MSCCNPLSESPPIPSGIASLSVLINDMTKIPPTISSASAKAPDNVIWMMLGVILLGAILLFPALGYLFFLFKSTPARGESV